MRGRTVSLVVCASEDGSVLGEIEGLEVPTPWWQDVEPIQARCPQLRVLRLLAGEPAPGAARPAPPPLMGGEVTYLAEVDRADAGGLCLRRARARGGLDDHPLRMPWARPGGPGADLAWAASVVHATGPPVQHRTWNLSSIWSIPTGDGRAWLKAVPGFFRHESTVLEVLLLAGAGAGAGAGVPTLLGADGHRILIAEMPGRDGDEARLEEQEALLDALVRLQVRTAGISEGLIAQGVPDARWPKLLGEVRALVRRRAPADSRLAGILADEPAARRIAAIEACGLPTCLVHGDAHPGNARIGTHPPVWFDWGDSCVGSPVLDRRIVEGAPPEWRDRLLDRWAAAWREAFPRSDPVTAWHLVEPIALLRAASVYQRFLDNIEPSEQVYHAGDVEPLLEAAAAAAANVTPSSLAGGA